MDQIQLSSSDIQYLAYELCSNVHPKWKEIFKDNSETGLGKAFKQFVFDFGKLYFFTLKQGKTIGPDIQYILRAFKLAPEDIHCVIVGQDPYPQKGKANGYAFGQNPYIGQNKDEKYNDALFNVIKATNLNDKTLHSWAAQGVMLLNAKLTIEIGGSPKPPAHKFSGKFVEAVIEYMSYRLCETQKIAFLLWGYDAKSLKKYMNESSNCLILTWTHPSPAADATVDVERRFEHNTNFEDVNKFLSGELGEVETSEFTFDDVEDIRDTKIIAGSSDVVSISQPKLRQIDWQSKQFDYDWPEFFIFTDGSCDNLNKNRDIASWAFCILKYVAPQELRSTKFDLKCPPNNKNYELIYEEAGKIGIMGDLQPTNNRAECFAMLKAMQKILELNKDKMIKKEFEGVSFNAENSTQKIISYRFDINCLLVSDSGYCLNLLNGLTNAEKNLDMIEKLQKNQSILKLRTMHTNSHVNAEKFKTMPFIYYWNEYVDKMAG